MNARTCLIVATLAIASVSGCASPGDVMQRAPAATLTSSKTVRAVVGCAAPLAFKKWPHTKVVPDEGGTMLLLGGDVWGNVPIIADVQPTPHGSTVTVRRKLTTDHVFNDAISNVITPCI
jgi:hypothetical protein